MIDWLAFTRSIHIAASILLAAVFAFRLIVLRPTASKCGCIDRFQPSFRGGWGRLVVASWMTVIFSGVAWFGLVAASISGAATLLEVSPETFKLVLFQTQFGHLWLVRSGCGVALGMLLLTKRRESILAGLSLAILASLAGAGHAGAIASSTGPLALLGDIGHLLATALWPGGLVPLLFVLYRERRAADTGSRRFVAEIVRRFSALSLVVVALLAATGILNARFIVGSLRGLFETYYGQLLLVKITLFLLMIGFGAWNLLVLKPGLIRLAVAENKGGALTPRLVESLIRNVACETLLAAGIILVVGHLGVTPPPAR
jgi:copper resistance protein D